MQSTIAQRLGRVLYWVLCGVAALVLAAGASVYYRTDGFATKADAEIMLAAMGIAFVIFLFGRGIRYILANE